MIQYTGTNLISHKYVHICQNMGNLLESCLKHQYFVSFSDFALKDPNSLCDQMEANKFPRHTQIKLPTKKFLTP